MTAETTPDHAFRTELTASGIVRLTWRSGLCITDQLAVQAMAAVDALNGLYAANLGARVLIRVGE